MQCNIVFEWLRGFQLEDKIIVPCELHWSICNLNCYHATYITSNIEYKLNVYKNGENYVLASYTKTTVIEDEYLDLPYLECGTCNRISEDRGCECDYPVNCKYCHC